MVRLDRANWFGKIIVAGSKWNVSQVELVLVAAFCVVSHAPGKIERTGLKSALFVQFCLIATLTLLIECNLDLNQSLSKFRLK